MSKLEELKSLNNKFESNLNEVDGFTNTKGLLQNFSEYISENKAILYALLGASILNITAKSLAPAIQEIQKSEITQAHKADLNEISINEAIVNFKKESDIGNNITNIAAIQIQDAVNLNDSTIDKINNLESDGSIFIKNPYAQNTVIEVKRNDETTSFLDEAHKGIEHQITYENSKNLVDYSAPVIKFNIEQTKSLADYVGAETSQEKADIVKYVLYHEAAHATRRQSSVLDSNAVSEMRHVDLELHSDISAIMLIGSETKDLGRFNYVADKVMDVVIATNSHQLDHNTLYGLAELKNAVNNNPELLNMKASDISEFSYGIVKKVNAHNFENDSLVKEMKSSVNTENLMGDITNSKNIDYVNYYAGKLYNKGIQEFDIHKFMEKVPVSRMERLIPKLSAEIQKDSKYDDIASLSYLKNFEKIKMEGGTYKDLNDAIKKDLESRVSQNPAIDNEMIQMMKTKIKIDELEYKTSDFEQIAKIRETNTQHLMTINNVRFQI